MAKKNDVVCLTIPNLLFGLLLAAVFGASLGSHFTFKYVDSQPQLLKEAVDEKIEDGSIIVE